MLKNISWTSYLIFILIALIIYYTTICLKYYKEEIKDILSGRSSIFSKLKSGNAKIFIARNQNRLHHDQSDEHDLLPLINQLTEEINESLKQAAANNLIKEELIYSLQQLAKKYFKIKGTPFQSFISNYVLVESANYSSVHLSEEDLNTMWVM